MARSPLVEQRKRRMTAAMTGATETFYILSVMIRWFRLGSLIINHMPESKTLRKKYRMNFGNRHANMWSTGCLGALDGTYIKVRVPSDDRKPYRSQKGEICTNVLGVCTRDLMFTYVSVGWEGSAADSRVLRDAISRPNGLKIPREMTQDPLDNEVPVDHTQDGNEHDDVISSVEVSNEWSDQRDILANAMFNEFNIRRNNLLV
uniref:Protein ALP1-like n=1 Tax=Tanacetum cinerariifolium TaxID=118510 RepID=A0A6L2LMP4_TANCI|nr:protein ALP1-like [Tanacetum cinerariifolium]